MINNINILEKKVGGTDPAQPLQTINYQYNIRGWMTKINDPKNLGGKLFGYKVRYNSVGGEQTPDPFDSALKVLPRYNGNIAEIDWRTSTVSGDHLRRYGYVYDKLNRLSAGFYQKDTNSSAREYYEKDPSGNFILSFGQRNSYSPMKILYKGKSHDFIPFEKAPAVMQYDFNKLI